MTTELSNAPAAWTCDSGDTLSETHLPDPWVSRSAVVLDAVSKVQQVNTLRGWPVYQPRTRSWTHPPTERKSEDSNG
jgi:hypothetical protein